MRIRVVRATGDDTLKVVRKPRDGSTPTVFFVRLPASPGMAALASAVGPCGEAELDTEDAIAADAVVRGEVVIEGRRMSGVKAA